MKCYYDSLSHSNLCSNPSEIFSDHGSYDSVMTREGGFLNVFGAKQYNDLGIYPVNVMGFPKDWSGKSKIIPVHILQKLPFKIIDAARNRKLIIVLMSKAEGYSLTYEGFDFFQEFHNVMQKMKLPPFSVILADANKEFDTEYNLWLLERKKQPIIGHYHFLTCFYYFHKNIPDHCLIKDAMNDQDSYDFNSLNKTIRPHRSDHIFLLNQHNILKNGLVSGYISTKEDPPLHEIPDPVYLKNISKVQYRITMKEITPLTIDGNWSIENPDNVRSALFNTDVYKKSLMSVITETQFHMSGMFITEKSFKSLFAGHPFIMIAQPLYLYHLEELGFRADFQGIDRRYDLIIDPYKRFQKVHEELIKWVNRPRSKKIKLLEESMDTIEHNFNHARNTRWDNDAYVNFRHYCQLIAAKIKNAKL